MDRSKHALSSLVLALGLISLDAEAVCDNTQETGDDDVWATHACWTEFRDWLRPYFNLQKNHWDEGWGWSQCDAAFAFPKMFNSTYLLTYGLIDYSLGPWHNDSDYISWASGSIHEFRYEPEDDDDAFATAYDGFWRTDRVEMKCLSFNNRSPGVRAGTMLHEATHVIYYRWKHQSNRPNSNCSKDCSDDWLFHDLGELPYGQLQAGKSGHKHSMTQIQIEYLCDLAEFHEGWVSFSVYNPARTEANNRMTNRIRNPPGWRCGLPRPLYAPIELSAIIVASTLMLEGVIRDESALIVAVTLQLL